METTTTPDYERGLTFEKVWASIQELRESQKETERILKEEAERQREESARRREEIDLAAKETAEWKKEMDKMMRRSNRQMGDLNRRFGQLAEHLVAPSIHKRFNELGYHFGEVSPGGHRLFGEDGKTKTEIDLLLENGDTIMAVEVKTRPVVKDVEHHIKRLEILCDHRRGINDKRKIKGAIAGAIFGTEEKKATLEAGLYVLEQSGDTMRIEVPEGFVPREW